MGGVMDSKIEIEYLLTKLKEVVDNSDIWVKEELLEKLKAAELIFNRVL